MWTRLCTLELCYLRECPDNETWHEVPRAHNQIISASIFLSLRPLLYKKKKLWSFEVSNIHNLLSFGLWMFEVSFDLGHYYTTKQNIEVSKLKSSKGCSCLRIFYNSPLAWICQHRSLLVIFFLLPQLLKQGCAAWLLAAWLLQSSLSLWWHPRWLSSAGKIDRSNDNGTTAIDFEQQVHINVQGTKWNISISSLDQPSSDKHTEWHIIPSKILYKNFDMESCNLCSRENKGIAPPLWTAITTSGMFPMAQSRHLFALLVHFGILQAPPPTM